MTSTKKLGTLHAPMKVEFDYTRSLGPVLSKFMTGLRDRKFYGARLNDGRVVVPPVEFDPVTHKAVTNFVPLSSTGTVQTWSWVAEPVAHQALTEPHALALIRLDGADSTLLHVVKVASPSEMHSGMRVQANWASERVGNITDVAYFEPVNAAIAIGEPLPDSDPIAVATIPVKLAYDYAASPEESAFFRGLAEGKILGQRCPKCQKVYVPPRGACPVDGVPTTDEVQLADRGIVTTFCIVNVPFLGQHIKPPYVSAYILLEGADIAFLHLLLDVDASEVRMGMRVEAVWKPQSEWGTTIENISHFRPTGEPDADFETYQHHL